jgi:translation elongation factor EF-Tu-like GTPase
LDKKKILIIGHVEHGKTTLTSALIASHQNYKIVSNEIVSALHAEREVERGARLCCPDHLDYVHNIIKHLDQTKESLVVMLADDQIIKNEDDVCLDLRQIGKDPQMVVFLDNPQRKDNNMFEVENYLQRVDQYEVEINFIAEIILIILISKFYLTNQEVFDWFLEFKMINGPRPPNKTPHY